MENLLQSIFSELLALFVSFSAVICFFGAFFLGGETVMILGFLSAQGLVKFWVVCVFCALGMFTADSMWFFIGKIKAFKHLKKIKFIKKSYIRASEAIEEVSMGQIFLTMTLLKFVYGIAIPILMYIGRKKKLTYRKFALYNALIIAPWAVLLTLLGWLAGKGYVFVSRAYENVILSVSVIVFAFILANWIIKRIRKWLLEEEQREKAAKKMNSKNSK